MQTQTTEELEPGTRVSVRTRKPTGKRDQIEYWWEEGTVLTGGSVALDRGKTLGVTGNFKLLHDA